jgi:hypothetical protein
MFYQNDLAMRNTADVTGGKPIAVIIAVYLRWDAVNTLVAFYGIHGRKRGVLFFSSVPVTTLDGRDGKQMMK